MQVLYQGAESKVYLDTLDGQDVIVKERISKGYRIKQLDDELRRQRTKKEVKLLTDVRSIGIPTPKILQVDETNCKILMENINGQRLKEHLNSISENDVKSLSIQLGKQIGKLHNNNIIHGDLTTSNMILKNGEIYFIDFSLGEFTQRIEEKAIDLKLLKGAVKSTHFQIFDLVWENILLGYEEICNRPNEVLSQLKEIEKRARYANRE